MAKEDHYRGNIFTVSSRHFHNEVIYFLISEAIVLLSHFSAS